MIYMMLDAPTVSGFLPGQHVVLLSKDAGQGIEARKLGLTLRDTLMVLTGEAPEFAFLFRKPLEGTVLDNTLKYGVGGLNIDACRISGKAKKPTSIRSYRRFDDKADKPELIEPPDPHPGGRWPTNLVLIHTFKCQEVGTRKVRAITGTLNGAWRRGHQYDGGYVGADASLLGRPIGYGDEDGTETVAAWVCQEDCVVKALDQQSGNLPTQKSRSNPDAPTAQGLGLFGQASKQKNGPEYFGDSGGASRFFPQFAHRGELMEWLRRLLGG